MSKSQYLRTALEYGSAWIHVDARRSGVMVPPWLTSKHQLVLQLGLNFPIPIRDLEIDEDGVRCTLSFNRSPFYCVLPWHAVYAIVKEDETVSVWQEDVPSELAEKTQDSPRKKPALRLLKGGAA